MAHEVFAAVSARGRSGLLSRPLIAAHTGRPSERVTQVVAEVAMPVPCLEHTELDPETRVCSCGTVRGSAIRAPMPSYDLRPLDGRGAFSLHPLRSAQIVFDRESRCLLAAACAPQVPFVTGPAQVCLHPRGG